MFRDFCILFCSRPLLWSPKSLGRARELHSVNITVVQPCFFSDVPQLNQGWQRWPWCLIKRAGGAERGFSPCSAASMLGDRWQVPRLLFRWLQKDDLEFSDLCVPVRLSIRESHTSDKDLSCRNIILHLAHRSQDSAPFLVLGSSASHCFTACYKG